MKRRLAGSLLAALFLWQAAAHAQTFQLKNGKTVSGTVKRESADFYVVIEDGGAQTVLLKSKILDAGLPDLPPASAETVGTDDAAQPASEWRSSPKIAQSAETLQSEESEPLPEGTEALPRAPAIEEPRKTESYPWYEGTKGYNQALRDQERNGNPIVLYFYTNWCRYCKIFKKGTLSAPNVSSAMTSVVRVSLNGDQERTLMQKYGVGGYPTFLVVPKYGQPSRISTGLSKDDFLKELRDAGLQIRA